MIWGFTSVPGALAGWENAVSEWSYVMLGSPYKWPWKNELGFTWGYKVRVPYL